MVLTHSRDVGRFMAAVLDLPVWENERMYLAGNRVTPNGFLRMVEEAKGIEFLRSTMMMSDVAEGGVYLSPGLLRGEGVKFPEGVGLGMVKVMVAGVGAEQASGSLDLPLEGSLNGVFSESGTLRVEEAVRVWVARERSLSS